MDDLILRLSEYIDRMPLLQFVAYAFVFYMVFKIVLITIRVIKRCL